MSGYTSGPWEVDLDLISGSDGDDVAYIALRALGDDKSEMNSNARLIATSPDLLKACKDALWLMGNDNDRQRLGDLTVATVYQIVPALRAAIARAEGKAE